MMTTIVVTAGGETVMEYSTDDPAKAAEFADTAPYIFRFEGDRVEVRTTTKPPTSDKAGGS